MKIKDLNFNYPENLVALRPEIISRVMWIENNKPLELEWAEFLKKFKSGDILVVNDTKVVPRRLFTQVNAEELEVLFVRQVEPKIWEVLCPLRRFKNTTQFSLPGGVEAEIVQKGKPQLIRVSENLTHEYFEKYGEPPLPPYIQKSRGSRHAVNEDKSWYQAIFAKTQGSSAAPTASLHFKQKDMEILKSQGVRVLTVTLHVGLGTYLPVEVKDLKDHKMHFEEMEVSPQVVSEVQEAKSKGHQVWALGTTVARALESYFLGMRGSTNLLIQEGFEWKVVDRLLTNFHQPESTLLALVAGFAGLENVLCSYDWAIKRGFRLFSYGDLTAWVKSPK